MSWLVYRMTNSAFLLGLVGFSSRIPAFFLAPSLWISLFFALIAGFGMMVHIASSNTLLQSIADDDKRGRVMSFYTMALIGVAPLGSLMLGSLAGAIGAPLTLVISGFSCVTGAFLIIGRRGSLYRREARRLSTGA